jgi:hypothetical protein
MKYLAKLIQSVRAIVVQAHNEQCRIDFVKRVLVFFARFDERRLQRCPLVAVAGRADGSGVLRGRVLVNQCVEKHNE